MSDTKKPAARINLYPVSIAIWANRTEKGVNYAGTIDRRYKDADGQWKNSDNFNENEFLLASKAFDLAHTEVLRLREIDRKASKSDDEGA